MLEFSNLTMLSSFQSLSQMPETTSSYTEKGYFGSGLRSFNMWSLGLDDPNLLLILFKAPWSSELTPPTLVLGAELCLDVSKCLTTELYNAITVMLVGYF